MEVEPEEGRAHSAVGEEGLDHGGAHDELKRRAALCVERRRELPIGRRGEEEEGKQAVPCPAAGAQSHGSQCVYVRRFSLFFTVSSVALLNCGGHEPSIYNTAVLSIA